MKYTRLFAKIAFKSIPAKSIPVTIMLAGPIIFPTLEMVFFEGLATFGSCPTFEAILKRMQSCDELEKQEQYQKESMKKRLKIIYEEIK